MLVQIFILEARPDLHERRRSDTRNTAANAPPGGPKTDPNHGSTLELQLKDLPSLWTVSDVPPGGLESTCGTGLSRDSQASTDPLKPLRKHRPAPVLPRLEYEQIFLSHLLLEDTG